MEWHAKDRGADCRRAVIGQSAPFVATPATPGASNMLLRTGFAPEHHNAVMGGSVLVTASSRASTGGVAGWTTVWRTVSWKATARRAVLLIVTGGVPSADCTEGNVVTGGSGASGGPHGRWHRNRKRVWGNDTLGLVATGVPLRPRP